MSYLWEERSNIACTRVMMGLVYSPTVNAEDDIPLQLLDRST